MASSSALHDCPAPYTWLWHKHLYSHLSPHLLLLSPLLTLIQIHYFSNMSNIIIPRTIFCSIWSLLQHHCGFLYSFLPGLFWKCTLLMMLLHLSLLVLTLLLVCFIVFHCADHFSVFFLTLLHFPTFEHELCEIRRAILFPAVCSVYIVLCTVWKLNMNLREE